MGFSYKYVQQKIKCKTLFVNLLLLAQIIASSDTLYELHVTVATTQIYQFTIIHIVNCHYKTVQLVFTEHFLENESAGKGDLIIMHAVTGIIVCLSQIMCKRTVGRRLESNRLA